MENFEDPNTNYLIASTSYKTATGMTSLLSVIQDKITRSLSRGIYESKYLWLYVKLYVLKFTQSKETIVSGFDDLIKERRYSGIQMRMN